MQIELDSPLDMHLHLRDNEMLEFVAPFSAKNFSAAVIMPNIIPPITTKEELLNYKKRVLKATEGFDFEPLMTLFFKEEYSKEFLKEIKDEIIAVKLYPAGVTTNSKDGVKKIDIDHLSRVCEIMSELGIILSIHGETNVEALKRESDFLPVYEELAKNFPKLKIIMEHITTKDAVNTLQKYDNLFATITLHHLLITLDDIIGQNLNPHFFCKPIAKTKQDRDAILSIALEANEKVSFGSDSAPHLKIDKETKGSAGIFSAPYAIELLTEIFDKYNKLDNLQKFISSNAKKIYNISPIPKKIKLQKKEFKAKEVLSSKNIEIVPFFKEQTIRWSIV